MVNRNHRGAAVPTIGLALLRAVVHFRVVAGDSEPPSLKVVQSNGLTTIYPLGGFGSGGKGCSIPGITLLWTVK